MTSVVRTPPKKRKNEFVELPSSQITSDTGQNIVYNDLTVLHSLSRKKKRLFYERIQRYADDFQNDSSKKECGCLIKIKKVYIGNDQVKYYYHLCSHELVANRNTQNFLHFSNQPRANSTRRRNNNSNQPRRNNTAQPTTTTRNTRNTRKRRRLEPSKQTVLTTVLPSRGPLKGMNVVHLYFGFTGGDALDRYGSIMQEINSEGNIGVIFGRKRSPFVGSVILSSGSVQPREVREKDPNYNQLVLSNIGTLFAVAAEVPKGNRTGPVTVTLSLFNNNLEKRNGYLYVDENDLNTPTDSPNTQPLEEKGEVDIFSGGAILSLNDDNDDGFFLLDNNSIENDLVFDGLLDKPKEEYKENQFDVFRGTPLHYAAAKGRLDLVKYFIDMRSWDADRMDLFGITPLRIARYFKRNEVRRYLETKIPMTNIRYEIDEYILEGGLEGKMRKRRKKKKKKGERKKTESIQVRRDGDVQEFLDSVFFEEYGLRGTERMKKKVDTKHLCAVYEGTYLSSSASIEKIRERSLSSSEDDIVMKIRLRPLTVEKYGISEVGSFIPLHPYVNKKEAEANDKLSNDPSIPNYRTMKPGMCFDYNCDNPKCEMNRNYQVVNFEFGEFDLVDLYATTFCVGCKKRINHEKILRVGFRRCYFRFYAIDKDFKIIQSEEKTKVGIQPHWLEGSLRGEGSKIFRKVKFTVTKLEMDER